MKGETLVQAVTNILFKKVTEDEAKEFALKQYGVLSAYIRNKSKEALKSKGLFFIFGLLILNSCSTGRYYTAYKIHTKDRNYYVDEFKVIDDTIHLTEYSLRKKYSRSFKVPFSDCEIIKSK